MLLRDRHSALTLCSDHVQVRLLDCPKKQQRPEFPILIHQNRLNLATGAHDLVQRIATLVSRQKEKAVMCKQRIASSQGFTASSAWHAYVGFTCLTLAVFHPGPSVAQSEGAQPAVALSAPAQQFLGAVSANFVVWDLDHDGKLTRAEIEIDMQNRALPARRRLLLRRSSLPRRVPIICGRRAAIRAQISMRWSRSY
jgi:hypothetical protein